MDILERIFDSERERDMSWLKSGTVHYNKQLGKQRPCYSKINF